MPQTSPSSIAPALAAAAAASIVASPPGPRPKTASSGVAENVADTTAEKAAAQTTPDAETIAADAGAPSDYSISGDYSDYGDPAAAEAASADAPEASEPTAPVAPVAATTAPDGSPLVSVDETRAAALAIKQGKQIAQIGGYTAATIAQLKAVVGKLHKRGLLDAEAAALYEDAQADAESDEEADAE